jgi:hypothetical protein
MPRLGLGRPDSEHFTKERAPPALQIKALHCKWAVMQKGDALHHVRNHDGCRQCRGTSEVAGGKAGVVKMKQTFAGTVFWPIIDFAEGDGVAVWRQGVGVRVAVERIEGRC